MSKHTKNYNLNSFESKTQIVDYLYNSLNLHSLKYRMLTTFQDLQILKNNEHYVSPNFSGKNAFIIFKKFNNNYYSVVIPRTSLKYNSSYLDINNLKIFPLNGVTGCANIYNGTILDGKLIKLKDRTMVFIITDVLYLEGKCLLKDKIENKLINIKVYIENYIRFTKYNKMKFEINKLYGYNDIKNLIIENKKNEYYDMYGIIFYPKVSGITILFNDIDFANDTVDINRNDKTAYILLKKKEQPDVFHTFITYNNKIVRCGIAYVPTMKLSRYLKQVFDSSSNNSIIFNCEYNSQFKKWLPIETVENVSKPDTLEKVKQLIN